MSAKHAARMQSWEVRIINSCLEVERMSQRELPRLSFFKAVALKIVAKYDLTWATVGA